MQLEKQLYIPQGSSSALNSANCMTPDNLSSRLQISISPLLVSTSRVTQQQSRVCPQHHPHKQSSTPAMASNPNSSPLPSVAYLGPRTSYSHQVSPTTPPLKKTPPTSNPPPPGSNRMLRTHNTRLLPPNHNRRHLHRRRKAHLHLRRSPLRKLNQRLRRYNPRPLLRPQCFLPQHQSLRRSLPRRAPLPSLWGARPLVNHPDLLAPAGVRAV